MVTDKKSGQKAKFGAGKMSSQIPGATVARRRGARGCAVQLPPGTQYDVSVQGRPGQPKEPLETTIMRPGQMVSLEGATVTGGGVESMGIGDTFFSYRPAADSHPTLALGTDRDDDGENGYYEIDNLDLGAGHVFTLGEDDAGRVVIDSDDPDLSTFDIKVRLEDEEGARDLTFDNVAFDDQGQAILGLDEQGGLIYGMDSDGDGIINAVDDDDDNDGTPDAIDTDDDGDGIPDTREPHVDDRDGDGQPDAVDADDDNDGIPDAQDGAEVAEPGDEPVDDSGDEAINDGGEDDDNNNDNDDTREPHVDDDDDGDGPPDAVDADEDNEDIPGVQDGDEVAEPGDGSVDAGGADSGDEPRR